MSLTASVKRKPPVQPVVAEPVRPHGDWRCFFNGCAKPGCFGIGTRLRGPLWACMEHRDAARAGQFECVA